MFLNSMIKASLSNESWERLLLLERNWNPVKAMDTRRREGGRYNTVIKLRIAIMV